MTRPRHVSPAYGNPDGVAGSSSAVPVNVIAHDGRLGTEAVPCAAQADEAPASVPLALPLTARCRPGRWR